MRIHLLYEQDIAGQPHGCSYIRLLRPFSHPAIANNVKISSGSKLPDEHLDAVILERLWLPSFIMDQAEKILEKLEKRNIPLIYTLDDNLLDLNLEPGVKNFPTNEQRQIMRMFAQAAKGVIVSTAPLAERMRIFNPTIEIVPNQLDERLFPPRKATGERAKLHFGYMGTFSHLEDLLMILPPLRRFLRRWGEKVEFEIVGISEYIRIKGLFEGLPVRYHHLSKKQIGYYGFVKWMRRNFNWDFAIAPLTDTPFNNGKSDLKVLDYGIWGIPGIFSATPSYKDTIRNGENGLCVPNTEDAWEEALETMASNAALRQRMSQAIAEEVRETRTLAQHAPDWEVAVRKILSA